MGILDRVKNMFTEEIEEPQSTKEDVKVEQEEEKKLNNNDVNREEKITTKELERSMPIFFDEDDFATLEKPKSKEEKTIVEEKYYTKKTETQEKKVFKLSPVISPVYGVLDKNYHKEDITPKRSTPKVTYYERESITIDEVRKKAYGTLEDELETSLVSDNVENSEEMIGSRVERKYRSSANMDDLMNPNLDEVINDSKKIEETTRYDNKSQTLEPIALEDFLLSDDADESDEDYKNPLDDTLTESDLFHLIDSMYDKEDE